MQRELLLGRPPLGAQGAGPTGQAQLDALVEVAGRGQRPDGDKDILAYLEVAREEFVVLAVAGRLAIQRNIQRLLLLLVEGTRKEHQGALERADELAGSALALRGRPSWLREVRPGLLLALVGQIVGHLDEQLIWLLCWN